MGEPFLAQYTVRSKQSYIFRTNHLVEITGASQIIAKTFDDIFRCADALGYVSERANEAAFSLEDVLGRFREGTLDLVELFIGGGNDTILFRDRTVFERTTRSYTKLVLERHPGMIPMGTGVELEKRGGTYDYSSDYGRLMDASDLEKKRMIPGRIQNAQPFAMMDRSTLQPYSHWMVKGSEEHRYSDEAMQKRQHGQSVQETKFLDSLVTERESLLAIVHADGNNMGIKIQEKLGGETSYDFCVTAMRKFTKEIRDVFSEAGKKAVDECAALLREKIPGLKESAYLVRWLVNDGDDATFICNARLAKSLTEAYLKAVYSHGEADGQSGIYSACAGICIFHSHYPAARAYDLAEQTCSEAKEPVHTVSGVEQGWIDFHYIRSGVNGDLQKIRSSHGTAAKIARPWLVCGGSPEDLRCISRMDKLAECLKERNVSRQNIKTFGAAYESEASLAALEWARICYNTEGLEKAVSELFPDRNSLFRALYDLSEIYDLWYRKEV